MRSLTAAQITALAQRTVMLRKFIWAESLPDPVGFWNDLGTQTLDGRVYHGSGSVIEVAPVAAKSDLQIPGLTITLSGLPTEAAVLVRGSTVAQRPITVYDGIFVPETHALIAPLIAVFVGVIDDITINTPAEDNVCTIVLHCESASRALTIKRSDTRSPASLAARSATDRFYEYTAGQREQTIYFGRQSTRPAPQATPAAGGGIAVG